MKTEATSMPMRILWLTENYPPSRGGMAQSCDRIIKQLRSVSCLIDVVHFLPHEHHHIKCDEKSNGRYIRCYIGKDSSHALNCLWNHIEAELNGSKHQSQAYSHVVCFGGYYPMKASPIYAQWLQCPLTVLLRGNDFDVSVFSTKKQPVLKQALETATNIACVTHDMTMKVNRWLEKDKATFIGNSIDLDEWSALPGDVRRAQEWRNNNIDAKKRVIGLFGHIKEKKGLRFFTRTLERSGYADKCHCIFIGDIDEKDVCYLQEQSYFSYTCLPFKDRFELIHYYLACDVIAIPSFYDGMPNVLLEAGGLGIPVIASNTAGMRDVVTEGKHGYLFSPGNFNECREALYKLATASKETLCSQGEALEQHISKNMHKDIERQQYEALLLEASRYFLRRVCPVSTSENALVLTGSSLLNASNESCN